MVRQNISEEDINFFAKEIARKVCSANKQNAIIMISGQMGTGKSYTALELARLISIFISERLGNVPENYFNMEDNVGIMVMDEIAKVYEHMDTHHHCVYIIDDAGATFNARRFTSDANIAQNDRMQTMRPHSNVVIFTVPMKSLMDKVVRNLSSYMIFMKQPMFEVNMTVCDIRKIEVDLASDKERVFRKYLQNHRGDKYKRHIFKKPPQKWCDTYDARRSVAEKKLAEQSRATVERANESKQPKKKKSEIYKDHLRKFNEGAFGDMSLRQSCIENGLPYQSVLNMKAELDIN
jgi:uridine kinase